MKHLLRALALLGIAFSAGCLHMLKPMPRNAEPITYAPPGTGQGAFILLIVVLVVAAVAWLGRKGLRKWLKFFKTKDRDVLKSPYNLNLACMVLKNPDHYLAELRRINSTMDMLIKNQRVEAAVALRNLFVTRDVAEAATKPLMETTKRLQRTNAAQNQLWSFRDQVEKELAGLDVDQHPHENCCIVVIVCANKQWAVKPLSDCAMAFSEVQTMLNQPMNGGEILDFVMFPRPDRVLGLPDGQRAFKNVCRQLMVAPVHV